VVPPVFKTGLAGIALAGGFDSLPPPPEIPDLLPIRGRPGAATWPLPVEQGGPWRLGLKKAYTP
jgi:hypothetical protein